MPTRHYSYKLALPLAIALLESVCAASAGTVSYNGYSFVGDDISITGPNPVYGGAGQITLYRGGGAPIVAWCTDTSTYLAWSGTYTVGPASSLSRALQVPTLTSDQIGEIGALKLRGDELLTGGATADQSAAIQIAIWTIEYENVESGFTYDTVNPNVDSVLTQYVNLVGPGKAWGEYSGFYVLTEAGNQTLITDAVPESSTWAMMLLGFAGLGFAAFHRGARREAVAG